MEHIEEYPSASAAGFGVEVELVGLRLVNDFLNMLKTLWEDLKEDNEEEDDTEEIKKHKKEIRDAKVIFRKLFQEKKYSDMKYQMGVSIFKGTRLAVHREIVVNGKKTASNAIEEAKNGEWIFTAEDIGVNSYAECRGEFIVDGTKVKIQEQGDEAFRIGQDIVRYLEDWIRPGEGQEALQRDDFLKFLQVRINDTVLSQDAKDIFNSVGCWNVKALPGKNSPFTIHVTTAMPIRNLLNVGQMNPITHKIKFSKDLICTQQKFRDWHHKKQVLKSESYMVPEDFLAFITLCSVYAKLGPHIQHANGVKETLQILPRNDFTSLFNYVNGHVVMQNFESPWSSSVAEVVKMNIDGNAFENQTLKWKDQSRNEKESDKEREFWHETPEQARSSELNVKRWLDEIPKRDWLTRMDSRVKWGDGSIGRLGGRFEWVAGRNDTKEYAPIWEFRGMSCTMEQLPAFMKRLDEAYYDIGKVDISIRMGEGSDTEV